MSGLYIHIPFCKQACNYCNFHFSTNTLHINAMIDSICKEITQRKNELTDNNINTIYFGGGTPSLLNEQQLAKIFNTINQHFVVKPNAEITLEANPDDITKNTLATLKNTLINRFSLGVQSFFDEELRWMNRAHNAAQAQSCVKQIQDFGFDKITIDLIYGSPTLSHTKWEQNLNTALQLGLKHISAYCLTIEPNTILSKHIKTGKLPDLDDEKAAIQFNMLVDILESNEFEQYEISNFAKNKQYAKHNTAYWLNKPYLGFGPSAHSFNGNCRSWNLANNAKYIAAISKNLPYNESEILTLPNKINEYLMTGLRTMWGCSWQIISDRFGNDITKQLIQKINPLVTQQRIENTPNYFKLTKANRIFADGIAAELFF